MKESNLGGEMKILLLIAILTVFSMVVFPGYDTFSSDHELYIPAIYQEIDSALFEKDFSLSFNQTRYTFFDDFIAFAMKLSGMDLFYVLVVLLALVKAIYFYAIYKIAFYFTQDRKISVFSMIVLMGGFFVYGSGMSTWHTSLLPSVMSLSLCLLFLHYFLNKKHFVSAIILGVALLIHPITALPFIILFYFDLFVIGWRRKEIGVDTLLFGLIPFLFLRLLMLGGGEPTMSILTTIDPIWEGLIRSRSPYIFITTWGESSTFNSTPFYLAASIFLFIVSCMELGNIFKNPERKKYAYLLFFIPALLFIFSFLTVDIMKIHFFAQLQMSRSLVIWKIFISLLFSLYAYMRIKDNPKDVLYNFLIMGIVFSFIVKEAFFFTFLPAFGLLWLGNRGILRHKYLPRITLFVFAVTLLGLLYMALSGDLFTVLLVTILGAGSAALLVYYKSDFIFGAKKKYTFRVIVAMLMASSLFFLPKFHILPAYYGDKQFTEVCDWIKSNTPKSSLFITAPFGSSGGQLRIACHRSVFLTDKDGAQIVFDRDFAIEWNKRSVITGEISKNYSLLDDISREYNIDYIFSASEVNLDYPLIFHNGKYFIYKID